MEPHAIDAAYELATEWLLIKALVIGAVLMLTAHETTMQIRKWRRKGR